MCGLTILFNIPSLENKTTDLFKFINNRGPDKKIYKECDGLKFLFSRLAIQDLSEKGDQPIFSKSKQFIMLFNGEIYNHKDIRLRIKKDFDFNSWTGTSDSETLIESFSFYGIIETLNLIKGMYSIFLYDQIKKKIYLINDIFGEKPLYYQINKDSFLVSSSINSFNFKSNHIEIDFNSVKHLLTNNYISHPNTIWKEVKKINPASIISFNIAKNGSIQNLNEEKYYNKNKKIEKKYLSFDSLSLKLENYLFESVERQLISDVPLGSFLSGGIDSSLITAIASKISSNNLSTFTIGFKESKFNEAIYASKIADYLKTDHNEKYLDNNNFIEIYNDIFEAFDEPFSDSSQIPTILLSKFCSSKVKVALTGDGGDELFGGYNRYVFNPNIWKIISLMPLFSRKLIGNIFSNNHPIIIIKLLKKLLFLINSRFKSVHYFDQKIIQLLRAINSKDLFEFSKKLSGHIDDKTRDKLLFKKTHLTNISLTQNIFEKNFRGMMQKDIDDYLPGDLLVKVDRSSMHHGLETRAPFLDKKVYEFSQMIPDEYIIKKGNSKIILKNILKKIIPNDLIDRPKQGFLIPINEILNNNEIKNKIDLLFNEEKIKSQNIFNYDFIFKLWSKYKKGYYFDQYLIWDLIVLQKWLDNNLNKKLI
tara:strand:+ start:3356 stop:5299 length:1944 start_codon:yes stop_codon:yes gene_type:complete